MVWGASNHLYMRLNGVTQKLDDQTSNLIGGNMVNIVGGLVINFDGPLDYDTHINSNGFGIHFGGVGSLAFFDARTDYGTLLMDGTGLKLKDNRASKLGFEYDNDYSANYTIRSIVDKGYVLAAKTFSGKQTFSPTTTLAGMNFGTFAGDPSTIVNSDAWYNSITNLLKARINGVTSTLLSASTLGTTGQILISNGPSTAPTFQTFPSTPVKGHFSQAASAATVFTVSIGSFSNTTYTESITPTSSLTAANWYVTPRLCWCSSPTKAQ